MTLPRTLLLLGIFSVPVLADDETSFETTPDPSWERVEPLKELGLNLAGFDFSNQKCRITCAVPPPQVVSIYGAAVAPRASLLAPTTYADAVASVDILTWQPPPPGYYDGCFPGVFTRIQPTTGLGKTTGFTLAVQPLQGGVARIRIYRATNEYLLLLTESALFTLDPSRACRLVLSTRGQRHTGRIYDLTNPATPIAEISAEDYTPAVVSGRCGFGVVMPQVLAADITFDNFLAWDGAPPPLRIRPGNTPGTIELLSDTRRSMGSVLQTAADPADPAAWLPCSPIGFSESGATLIRIFQTSGTCGFFRGGSL